MLALGFLVLGLISTAQASEQALKLAFVYNFVKFTEWPERASPAAKGLVNVCVVDPEGEYTGALGSLAGRTVRGFPLRARAIERVAEVQGCHALFISAQGKRYAAEYARAAQNAGALSVGDDEDFLRQGGMIVLVPTDNRLQFDVNQDMVLRAGINLNAQLLRLARSVRKESP